MLSSPRVSWIALRAAVLGFAFAAGPFAAAQGLGQLHGANAPAQAVPAGVPADLTPLDGFWVQLWKAKDDADFKPIGVIELRADGRRLVVSPLAFTYTARDSAVPDRYENIAYDGRSLGMRLVFPNLAAQEGQPKEITLDFLLTHDNPGQLSGPATLNAQQLAQTRFLRVNDRAELRQILASVRTQIQVEKAVSEGQVPPLRESVRFWTKQLEEDRRMGRSTTGTQTRFSLTVAEGAMSSEEARLTKLELFERRVNEVIVRLDAEIKAKGTAFR